MKLRAIQKLVLITLITLSASAFAEDKINWTGFYGSATVGRTWGHVSEGNGFYSFVPGPEYYTSFGNNGSSFNGWSGNFKLGYNKQIDNNLLGIELGAAIQSAKANGIASSSWDEYPTPIGDVSQDTSLHSQTQIKTYETLALKLGHIFNDTTLVYVSGGAALGQVKRSVTQTTDIYWFANGYSTSDNKTELGYKLGFGGEYKLNQHWALLADYEYVNFGNINFKYTGPFDDYTINTMTQSNSIHLSNLSAGVSYAF
jgi:opacity protein-like surface antigen